MYWFTADEHYHHSKILEYCNRPFSNVEEMNEALIANHNRVVGKNDVTVHVGDFAFVNRRADAEAIIRQLNGNHIFVKGSHDRWLPDNHQTMWRKHIDGQFIVCCHYALRTWERAHYGAWNLYGHSHGTLPGIGKQMDVGVDCLNFTPISFADLTQRMNEIPQLQPPQ